MPSNYHRFHSHPHPATPSWLGVTFLAVSELWKTCLSVIRQTLQNPQEFQTSPLPSSCTSALSLSSLWFAVENLEDNFTPEREACDINLWDISNAAPKSLWSRHIAGRGLWTLADKYMQQTWRKVHYFGVVFVSTWCMNQLKEISPSLPDGVIFGQHKSFPMSNHGCHNFTCINTRWY